jgi:hypothetical protein
MNFRKHVAAALAAVLLSGATAAQADTAEYMKEQLARYEQYAGEPVDEFRMFSLWKWQVVGPTHLVAWSTIKDAYLIRVDKACSNLAWTKGLGITQNERQKVSRRFDFVTFGSQRCKIEEIRPVDIKAMHKASESAANG